MILLHNSWKTTHKNLTQGHRNVQTIHDKRKREKQKEKEKENDKEMEEGRRKQKNKFFSFYIVYFYPELVYRTQVITSSSHFHPNYICSPYVSMIKL